MIENPDSLEQELAAMRPRRPSAELVARIGADLAARNAPPPPPRDRLLAWAIGAGALAASVIAVMLLVEPRTAAPMSMPAEVAARLPGAGDVPPAFAWADRRRELPTLLETP